MAKELLKLDDEQRDGLTQWLSDPDNLDPHAAFTAMQIAPGLGSHPSRSELELTPLDHIAQKFGYVTDRTKNAEKLSLAQETLLPFVQKAIGHKLQMKLLRTMAGSAQQAHEQFGIPLQPSQIPYEGPAAPTPRFSPQELQQMSPEQAQEFGSLTDAPKMLTLAEQQPPSTQLEPSQLKALELVQGGHGVFDQGKFVPMSLAKLPGSMMSPTEANAALKSFGIEEMQPFTEPISTSTFNEILKQRRGEGQPAIIKEQAELSRLNDIPAARRSPAQRAMIQTLTDSIGKSTLQNPDNTNEWAGALFGAGVTYKNLANQRPVTAAQSKQWKDLHNVDIPAGTSPLAAVKAAQVRTQQAIAYAGTLAKNDAQLDTQLGPRSNDYRKLMPDGRIVQAGARQTARMAGDKGYVDIKGYEDTIERAQTVRVTEDRVRDVQKLGLEIFKADPGILSKGKQIVELSLASFANAGKKIDYLVDGKPLTLGEAVNLYNGKTKQMLEAVSRSVNAVKGAGTEGDVLRQLEGFPQPNVDTASTAKAKYQGLIDAFVNSRRALYSTVFGEEAADEFAKTIKKGKVLTPDERMDEIESLLKSRLGK